MEYQLIIVTADNCGACRMFKANVLPELKKKLYIPHEHFDLLTMAESITLPDHIKVYVAWFPTLILVVDDGVHADHYIFNGTSNNGKVTSNPRYNGDVNGIQQWMQDVTDLSSNVVFNKDSRKVYTNNPLLK